MSLDELQLNLELLCNCAMDSSVMEVLVVLVGALVREIGTLSPGMKAPIVKAFLDLKVENRNNNKKRKKKKKQFR
ncbi:hypothetical protein Syun_027038 [Stephania yunnanensis]|uniref:Uncharacterized protein n=1 Tax=Stephania yunnanensis TaxID=152371 RepID=A0AAP0HPK5_9MAGN